MKMDEITEKEIIKCSRCALCADVCPLYAVKRKEGSLLRGKFLQLLGIIRGDLKFTKKIKKSLDECIACEKCSAQCPSGILPTEIFSKLKSQNMTVFERFLASKFTFKIKIFALKVFYRVKHPAKPLVSRKKPLFKSRFNELTHFNGCLSKCIDTAFWLPYEFKKSNFVCCGLPYKAKGNLDEYRNCAEFNIKKIENTRGLVVFNCATCLSSVLSYSFNSPKDKAKCVFYTEIYKECLKKYVLSAKKPVRVAFHYPCHLKSAGVSLFDIENILSNIQNVEYKKLENIDECCGFGGDYFTRHFKTADVLSTKKAEGIIKSGVDVVLTACPTCLWSIKYGLKKLGAFKIKAYDLAEFLSNLNFDEIMK